MNVGHNHDCSTVGELLGAYALDALDSDEATFVVNHVSSCPRCRQEDDLHRETAGLLAAAAGGAAPEGVWDRISAAIDGEARRDPPVLLPFGDVAASRPFGEPAGSRPFGEPAAPRPFGERAEPAAPVPFGAVARRRIGPKRLRVSARAAVAAVAAAAAVMVGVQTFRVDHLNHQVTQLNAAARQQGGFQGLAEALVDPSAKHLVLASTTPGAKPVGQLVILPSGSAFLVGSRLPAVPAGQVYQLWSVVDGRTVSVGLLGAKPTSAAFTVDPAVTAKKYLVTVEPAGGVVAPTTAPVAQAEV